LKLALRLGLLLGVTLLCVAQAPVSMQSQVDGAGDGRAVVTNLGPIPVTAFLFEVIKERCAPTTLYPRIFRGEDAATTPKTDALAASHARVLELGAAYCNKTGARVPDRAVLRAAILADGSSSGDSSWVALLIENRQLQLTRLDKALRLLESAGEPRRAQEALESTDIAAERVLPCLEIANADPRIIVRDALNDTSVSSRERMDRAREALLKSQAVLQRALPSLPTQARAADPQLCQTT
jgi:hypothetical protein